MVRLSIILVLSVLSISCVSNNPATKMKGWTLFPVPTGQFPPGSIVSVTDDGGIRWHAHIKSCVSSEAISPTDPAVSPGITHSYENDYSLEALIAAYGISAGPNLSSVSGLNFSMSQGKIEGIDEAVLKTWLEKNPALLSAACKKFLTVGYYVVTQAWSTDSYVYDLTGETGVGLDLTTNNLSKYFSKVPKSFSLANGGFMFGRKSATGVVASEKVYYGFQGGYQFNDDGSLAISAEDFVTLSDACTKCEKLN